jgi:hypothetical protein
VVMAATAMKAQMKAGGLSELGNKQKKALSR